VLKTGEMRIPHCWLTLLWLRSSIRHVENIKEDPRLGGILPHHIGSIRDLHFACAWRLELLYGEGCAITPAISRLGRQVDATWFVCFFGGGGASHVWPICGIIFLVSCWSQAKAEKATHERGVAAFQRAQMVEKRDRDEELRKAFSDNPVLEFLEKSFQRSHR
jgi:hypothetical protein